MHLNCSITQKDKTKKKAQRDHIGWGFIWEPCVVYFFWCKTPEIQQSLVHALLPAARKTALQIKSPEQWWWLVNTVFCLKTRMATVEWSPHCLSLRWFRSTYQKRLNLKVAMREELVCLETKKKTCKELWNTCRINFIWWIKDSKNVIAKSGIVNLYSHRPDHVLTPCSWIPYEDLHP